MTKNWPDFFGIGSIENRFMNMSNKDLFEDLIWPACAGNVIWAFFNLVIDHKTLGGADLAARLTVLFWLGLYLVFNWKRHKGTDKSTSYVFADSLHFVTVVFFAIASATSTVTITFLTWSLAALLFVSVVAHLKGVWPPYEENQHFKLAGVNGAGLIALLGYFLPGLAPWHLPISLGLVIILWLYVRNCIPGYRQ